MEDKFIYVEKNRLRINAQALELLAECPASLNNISAILQRKFCPRTQALEESYKHILCRQNKLHTIPQARTIKKRYDKRLSDLGIKLSAPEVTKSRKVISNIIDSVKNHVERVAVVDVDMEMHFGEYTVYDNIPAILDVDGVFTALHVRSNSYTDERLLTLRTMFNSLWIREQFNVDANSIQLITISDDSIETQSFEVDVEAGIIENSIRAVLTHLPDKSLDYTSLPVVFGSHCYTCMMCFT